MLIKKTLLRQKSRFLQYTWVNLKKSVHLIMSSKDEDLLTGFIYSLQGGLFFLCIEAGRKEEGTLMGWKTGVGKCVYPWRRYGMSGCNPLARRGDERGEYIHGRQRSWRSAIGVWSVAQTKGCTGYSERSKANHLILPNTPRYSGSWVFDCSDGASSVWDSQPVSRSVNGRCARRRDGG